ncbi:hypothetical protein MAJ_11275, partial [Metarhizium majus ARSEF 297]
MSKFISAFKYVPVLLFRLNAGRSTKLREYSARRTRSFDVLSEAGMVKPKALDPSNYEAPNGASMRPLGVVQTNLVKNFKGTNVVVYAIPEGTALPDDLILVHEKYDHYSLQPAVEMSLTELNKNITEFLEGHATSYSRDQWLEAFENVGMSQSSSLAGAPSSSHASSSDPQWLWNSDYGRYYYYDEFGGVVWAPDTERQHESKSSKKNNRR